MSRLLPIVLASDHAGYGLKNKLILFLQDLKIPVLDLGTNSEGASVDYPSYALKMVEFLQAGEAEKGILICGTGIGMSIAANRHLGIRAANCMDVTTTRLARAHNDANILTLGARIISENMAKDCVQAFLETPFEGGRHLKRIEMLG